MARIQPSGTVRYTELSPTGSETSGADRQSEIVAAINGPIAHLLWPRGEKAQSVLARVRGRMCVRIGRGLWRPITSALSSDSSVLFLVTYT